MVGHNVNTLLPCLITECRRLGFKGGSKLGVAEWRLKINQPSLFQFVRKQKRKEIIKRERVGRGEKKEQRRTEPPQPKMQGEIGKAKRRENTKGKGDFAEFSLFVSLRPLPLQYLLPQPTAEVLGLGASTPGGSHYFS